MGMRCWNSYNYVVVTNNWRKSSGVNAQRSVYVFTSSMTLPLDSGMLLTAKTVERERRMAVLYKATKVLMGYPQERRLKRFDVMTRELVEYKCLPLLVAFCCNTPECKNM